LRANKNPLNQLLQQPVAQFDQHHVDQIPGFLTTIPWGHHLHIITKCKEVKEALYYIQQTCNNNWSRSVLVHQVESNLYKRKGKALTNFESTLPKVQSDLANELLKNPYQFDFLSLGEEASERELENALANHLTKFLLELGAGFAYLGRQYPLKVEDNDFFIDLLFYHTQLHCHVVVELKIDEFKPEYAGKLNFYLNAVDAQLKHVKDEPTIGLLLCKKAGKLIVEYSLKNISKPIGVSEYQLVEALPKKLKGNLPSIRDIENELTGIITRDKK
jgi:predicted nuclease of restriction endonuclease-like (RecB) superfamily